LVAVPDSVTPPAETEEPAPDGKVRATVETAAPVADSEIVPVVATFPLKAMLRPDVPVRVIAIAEVAPLLTVWIDSAPLALLNFRAVVVVLETVPTLIAPEVDVIVRVLVLVPDTSPVVMAPVALVSEREEAAPVTLVPPVQVITPAPLTVIELVAPELAHVPAVVMSFALVCEI